MGATHSGSANQIPSEIRPVPVDINFHFLHSKINNDSLVDTWWCIYIIQSILEWRGSDRLIPGSFSYYKWGLCIQKRPHISGASDVYHVKAIGTRPKAAIIRKRFYLAPMRMHRQAWKRRKRAPACAHALRIRREEEKFTPQGLPTVVCVCARRGCPWRGGVRGDWCAEHQRAFRFQECAQQQQRLSSTRRRCPKNRRHIGHCVRTRACARTNNPRTTPSTPPILPLPSFYLGQQRARSLKDFVRGLFHLAQLSLVEAWTPARTRTRWINLQAWMHTHEGVHVRNSNVNARVR